MYQTLRYEKQENIGILTINRPEALNALNSTVIGDLEQAITEVEKDAELGALIITGEGRSFVAGADIGEQLPLDVAGGRKWGQRGSALMRRIEKLEIPTIAAVNGFALGGGCELAMACDIRLASEKAKFGQPEVGLGITPGFGGTQRLARIVGTGRAMELIFTAKVIDAAAAEKVAFVFMGHGTSHTAKVSYSQMQTTMQTLGYDNVFIGTVEGKPEETACENVIEAVKAAGYTKVILRPLMVVAGDHANNDMAGEDADSWLSQFKASGAFDSIGCQIAGLGEIEDVQKLYVAHTKAAIDSLNG